MDEDFQKEEAMKDILIKNERIKILERENNILMIENKLLKEGLKCSVEAKSYKIAEQCLKELRHEIGCPFPKVGFRLPTYYAYHCPREP